MRLSIFNSRWLIWPILALFLAGASSAEVYYRSLHLKPQERKKDVFALAGARDLLIVGDSRADAGLVPSVLGRALSIPNGANLGSEGVSPINQLEVLALMGERPRLIIVAVSPASVYGIFYRPPPYAQKMVAAREHHSDRGARQVLEAPFHTTEGVLSGFAKEHLYVAGGFKTLRAAFWGGGYGEVRHKDGWLQVNPLGERAAFTRLVNVQAYSKLTFKGTVDLSARDAVLGSALDGMRKTACLVLVRLPCAPGLRAIENQHVPDFDRRMQAVAAARSMTYIASLPGFQVDWSECDGSHLLAPAAEDYSKRLGAQIHSQILKESAQDRKDAPQGG